MHSCNQKQTKLHWTSDLPKSVSAEISADISAEISAETEISVKATEIQISVNKEYKFFFRRIHIFDHTQNISKSVLNSEKTYY